MVKRLLAILMFSFIGLGMITSAEAARRLGGGKSIGMQRQATPPREAVKAPAQQAPQPAAAPGAPAKPALGGMGRWLAPLAAFGLGAALMSMFGGSMMAGALGNILMLLLLAGAVFFVIKMLRRKAEPASPQPMQYAGVGAPALTDALAPASASSGTAQVSPADRPAYPAGFDVDGFMRQAKLSFIRLQAANDAGDVRDIRDYTTPELYAELAMQIQERGAVAQKTDILTLNAELLEVVEEADRAIASVRFSGLIREEDARGAEPVDETWHVVKELKDPKATWLVAGIQQNG